MCHLTHGRARRSQHGRTRGPDCAPAPARTTMPYHYSDLLKPAPMSVLLADPQPLLRLGVAALLDAQPDMRVVAQAASGQEIDALCALHRPDLVCVDLPLLDPHP